MCILTCTYGGKHRESVPALFHLALPRPPKYWLPHVAAVQSSLFLGSYSPLHQATLTLFIFLLFKAMDLDIL